MFQVPPFFAICTHLKINNNILHTRDVCIVFNIRCVYNDYVTFYTHDAKTHMVCHNDTHDVS